MRVLLVLAITIPVLFAFGVACGGDEKEVHVTPSPASESEGDAEEAGEVEGGETEEGAETDEAGEEPGPDGDGDGVPDGDDDGVADDDDDGVADDDDDGVPDDIDRCPDTAAGDAVDDFGCADAQVDADGDGICDPGAPMGPGPSGCVWPFGDGD